MNTQNTNTQIKTIDVNASEWFDRVNGNSYFAALVTVNYSLPDEKTIKIPLHYGYGDYYRHAAFDALQKNNIIPKQESNVSYWRYYQDNNIIARHYKKENCRKKDLISLLD